MAERPLHRLPDADLEAALRGLAPAIAWPTPTLTDGTDIAASVRARLEVQPRLGGEAGSPGVEAARPPTAGFDLRARFRPARRALVLALLGILAVAALAGAAILGLPGLRITQEPLPSAPRPAASAGASAASTPAPLGARLRLGRSVDPADGAALDETAGFDVRWPDDPRLGTPDAAFVDPAKGDQVTLLWATDEDLPATIEPAIGLLLGQFPGAVDDGFFQKAADSGSIIERVSVNGQPGYWISGEPHVFFWQGEDGFVDDARRWVGDALVWADGPITYRLETSLGRVEAIRIAESLP